MNRDDEHLFGLPGAESLHGSVAEVWESELDGQDEDDYPFEVEEWTIRPVRSHFPTADVLIEYIAERWLADETDEYFYEHALDHAPTELAEEFLLTWAKAIHYRMADKLVATHIITLVDDEPHCNGEPIYIRSDDGPTT